MTGTIPTSLSARSAFPTTRAPSAPAGSTATGAATFVLEAKQATAKGTLRRGTPAHQTRLLKAKQQAAGYVRALDPASEPAVPFLIVLDVGGSFDLYADFTRTNRYWTAFPDAATGRIQLADLVRPEIRARLPGLADPVRP